MCDIFQISNEKRVGMNMLIQLILIKQIKFNTGEFPRQNSHKNIECQKLAIFCKGKEFSPFFLLLFFFSFNSFIFFFFSIFVFSGLIFFLFVCHFFINLFALYSFLFLLTFLSFFLSFNIYFLFFILLFSFCCIIIPLSFYLCLLFVVFLHLISLAQSAGAVEYTDCTSAEG